MKLKRPSQNPSDRAMEQVARQLGAPSAAAFIDAAPHSMLCCFKLACNLTDRIFELEAGHKILGTEGHGQFAQPSVASLESGANDGASADLARPVDAEQVRNGGFGTTATDGHGRLSKTPTD